MPIPDDILDQIRLRTDIVELVASYVPNLKRAGQTWKACCPFHNEKTPSFTVNPSRQSYKCFGCGKGGNAFSFVMEVEKLDFRNAAEFLARKCGVVIPEEEGYHRGQKKSPSDYNVRERLYTLHEKLAAWYAAELKRHPDSAVARYFATRGVPQEFAEQFMIGASPDAWDGAINFALKENFTEEELKLAGIVSEKEGSTHVYDRFRNRLMFPIWNEQGRIVGFSARTVEKDPKSVKYVNTPETPVFKKSRLLYGLNFARKSIGEKACAVICEGQLDVIAMHRAGNTNAVAPQGTAFNEEYGKILKRYTETICLATDNDGAGRKALFADARILLPQGFALKAAVFPDDCKDSDEVLKKHGGEALRKAVEDAKDFFEYALTYFSAANDMTSPAGRSRAANSVLEYIILIENKITRSAYTKWLAKKLDLDLASLEDEIRTNDVKSERINLYREQRSAERDEARRAIEEQNARVVPPAPKERSVTDHRLAKLFREFLEIISSDASLASAAANDITSEMLDKTPDGIAIETVIQASMNGEWEDALSIAIMELEKRSLDASQIAGLASKETFEKEAPEKLRARYLDCVKGITLSYLEDERAKAVASAAKLPEGEEKIELVKKCMLLSKQIRDLSKDARFRRVV